MYVDVFTKQLSTFFIKNFNELAQCIPQPVKQIEEIVKDYFGEDNVDLQIMGALDSTFWRSVFSNIDYQVLCDDCGVSTEFFSTEILNKCAYDALCDFNNDDFENFMHKVKFDALYESKTLPLYTLLIKFQNIIITNEQDVSTNIEEMFTRIALNSEGKIIRKFHWARTIYSHLHFISQYTHSHVPPHSRTFDVNTCWKLPCLGSGPIAMTLHNLQLNFQPELWLLFCKELDLCIRTESIAGGPYIRISEIKQGISAVFEVTTIYNSWVPDFITDEVCGAVFKRVLQTERIKWIYRSGHLDIVNNICELTALFSQAYFEYIKEEAPDITEQTLLEADALMLGQFTAYNTILKWEFTDYYQTGTDYPLNFSFKGNQVRCTILPYDPTSSQNGNAKMLLLCLPIVSYFYKSLTLLANNLYGNN